MSEMDDVASCITQLIQTIERLHREKRLAITMLYQLGMENVEAVMNQNLGRPDVKQALDLELHDVQELRERLLRYTQTGNTDFLKLPPKTKPN